MAKNITITVIALLLLVGAVIVLVRDRAGTPPAGPEDPGAVIEQPAADAGGDEAAMPTAAEVVAAAVEAMGGAAALRDIESVSMRGSIDSNMVGPGRIERYYDSAGRYYEEMDFFERDHLGRFGFDGETAWVYYPVAHRLEEPRRYKAMIPMLLDPSEFSGPEKTTFGQTECWMLIDRDEDRWYFDVASGLPVGQEVPARGRDSGVMRIGFTAWTQIGPIVHFTGVHEQTDPPPGLPLASDRSQIVFAEVKVNSVDPGRFELPPVVTKILEDPERKPIRDADAPRGPSFRDS